MAKKRINRVAISSFVVLVGALVFFSFLNPVFVNQGTTQRRSGISTQINLSNEGHYLGRFESFDESAYQTKLGFDKLIAKLIGTDPALTFRDALSDAERTLRATYPRGNQFQLLMTFEMVQERRLFRRTKEKIQLFLWAVDRNERDPLVAFEFSAETSEFRSAQVKLPDDRFQQYYNFPDDVTNVDIAFNVLNDGSLSGVLTGYGVNGEKSYVSKVFLIKQANAQATNPRIRGPFLANFVRRATRPTTPTRPTLPTRVRRSLPNLPTWPSIVTRPTRPTRPTIPRPPTWPPIRPTH